MQTPTRTRRYALKIKSKMLFHKSQFRILIYFSPLKEKAFKWHKNMGIKFFFYVIKIYSENKQSSLLVVKLHAVIFSYNVDYVVQR